MRDRKIQRMVKKNEVTHAEGERMAAMKARKTSPPREEQIRYRNSEHYSDPTAFLAMQSIVREQRKATKNKPRNRT